MKLSELLAEHPTMDVELSSREGDLYLDGVYIFRILAKGDDPGDSTLSIHETDHTDWVVKLGLVNGAHTAMTSKWRNTSDD